VTLIVCTPQRQEACLDSDKYICYPIEACSSVGPTRAMGPQRQVKAGNCCGRRKSSGVGVVRRQEMGTADVEGEGGQHQ